MSRPLRLLLTCEHAGNRVPEPYSGLFRGHARLLASHRGYDRGALEVARHLAGALHCPLLVGSTTRLLVDLNRAATNRRVFSEITRGLPEDERARLVTTYHQPYRRRVREAVRREVKSCARVVHIAVHTFTPRLSGKERRADVGLLYDPARVGERAFCHTWRGRLRALSANLVVRCNYPYRGTADGVPTWLRREFSDRAYLGIELEVNQARLGTRAATRVIANQLLLSLRHALANHGVEPMRRLGRTRRTGSK
jgi:predicted N-formylglutamate amidohydrolase